MPIYELPAHADTSGEPCAGRESFMLRCAEGPFVPCDECDMMVEKLMPSRFSFGGDTETGKPIVSKQLGRTFKSARELDNWCEENNCVAVNNDSTEWRSQVDEAAGWREEGAIAAGYRDAEHEKVSIKENLRDIQAANREASIKTYVDDFGTADAGHADSDTWKSPLAE